MNGQERSTCHYHKYGYCREKNECERFHSLVICSKIKCDVKNCRDRHPQQCKFFASQEFCKFGDSCKYDHKVTGQKKALQDELEDLQKRFDEVLKITSRHEDTIRFLQYKLDMMGKQMIGAVREMSEHIEYIEDVTRENEKEEKMDYENSKTNRKENLDDSYDIHCDAQFKVIIEKQRDIAAEVEYNLMAIESCTKKTKKEETLSNLTTLKSLVEIHEKEMKQMLENDARYLEYYENEHSDENGDSNDDDWKPKMEEMFKFFNDMNKNIESLPGNSFKKNARIEMKKMIKIASEMKEDRNSEINLKFS